MKLYTPPEMSKKLVEIGCVSHSEMFWMGGKIPAYLPTLWWANHENLPAFEFEDFASVEEFSIRNRMSLSWTTRDNILQSNNWVEEVGRGL